MVVVIWYWYILGPFGGTSGGRGSREIKYTYNCDSLMTKWMRLPAISAGNRRRRSTVSSRTSPVALSRHFTYSESPRNIGPFTFADTNVLPSLTAASGARTGDWESP